MPCGSWWRPLLRKIPHADTPGCTALTLLADADHEVAEAYGTWMEKRNYGRTYWGVQRATFIIDPDGKIARVFPKVSPQTHDDVVLDALGGLPAQA